MGGTDSGRNVSNSGRNLQHAGALQMARGCKLRFAYLTSTVERPKGR